jgi:hypothetical protein
VLHIKFRLFWSRSINFNYLQNFTKVSAKTADNQLEGEFNVIARFFLLMGLFLVLAGFAKAFS